MKRGVLSCMNAQVIHIDFQPSFWEDVGEDVIHETLECGRCIVEPEEHNCQFKQTKGGDEGSFPLILLLNANVVVTPSDVKFGEDGGVFHVINEFGDEGKRVSIANGV